MAGDPNSPYLSTAACSVPCPLMSIPEYARAKEMHICKDL